MKKKLRDNENKKFEVRVTDTVVFPPSYLLGFLIVLIIFMTGCRQNHESNSVTYTCPMHQTVVSDKPGTCPVCGMNLVLKGSPGEEFKITADLSANINSPSEAVITSIKTIKGEYKSMPVYFVAQGIVTYDTKKIYTIPSRVSGRLEKIFLKYAYQAVSKGEKIAEIYSPELIAAQRELLFLVENDAENKMLIDATRYKLELLGMNGSQLNLLIQNKRASDSFIVYSPYTGYVITDPTAVTSSLPPSSKQAPTQSMTDGMGSSSSNSNKELSLSNNAIGSIVREGTYISAGQTLFSVVDTRALRVELDVPAKQASSVKKGDKIDLDFGSGNKEKASIDFVQPFFTEGQDFIKLRVNLKEVEGLHIGQLVSATITMSARESLWVPRESVIDLGTNKIVFIKDKSTLKPRKVSTGISDGGLIEIKNGLASSEEIAANAQYLVDSDSFIKTTQGN